jgi:hypothetical protein
VHYKTEDPENPVLVPGYNSNRRNLQVFQNLKKKDNSIKLSKNPPLPLFLAVSHENLKSVIEYRSD